MMERNFYNDEFEQLIRDKTDQYKMYPSEKVWKGIHGSLHTKRRWFIGVMSFLITGTIFFAGKELIFPGNRVNFPKKIASNASSVSSLPPAKITEEKENNLSAALSDFNTVTTKFPKIAGRPETRGITTAASSDTDPRVADNHPLPAPDPAVEVVADRLPADKNSVVAPVNVNTQTVVSSAAGIASPLPVNEDHHPGTEDHHAGIKNTETISRNPQPGKTQSAEPGNIYGINVFRNNKDQDSHNTRKIPAATTETLPVTNDAALKVTTTAATTLSDNTAAEDDSPAIPGASRALSQANAPSISAPNAPEPAAPGLPHTQTGQSRGSNTDLPNANQQTAGNETSHMNVNWLEEYALYELIPPARRKSRRSVQLYFSPTVNYRKLSGDNNTNSKTDIQNIPLALNHDGKVNDFVNHKPAMGFELGGNVLYRASRNLTLKAGLQFNYIQYAIKAYASNPERATIGLNSTYGYYTDSITSYTSIRNLGGRTPTTLSNQYFQLSVPVGFELRILGNERLQLNIAGTIQPTYLLNRNSWLLTTDYTNYTKEPSLFRRWNLNGGAEVFLSYRIGGMRWQIGPEFRYQLLSTYSSQYPIHENLREYGLKIGVSKTIR